MSEQAGRARAGGSRGRAFTVINCQPVKISARTKTFGPFKGVSASQQRVRLMRSDGTWSNVHGPPPRGPPCQYKRAGRGVQLSLRLFVIQSLPASESLASRVDQAEPLSLRPTTRSPIVTPRRLLQHHKQHQTDHRLLTMMAGQLDLSPGDSLGPFQLGQLAPPATSPVSQLTRPVPHRHHSVQPSQPRA